MSGIWFLLWTNFCFVMEIRKNIRKYFSKIFFVFWSYHNFLLRKYQSNLFFVEICRMCFSNIRDFFLIYHKKILLWKYQFLFSKNIKDFLSRKSFPFVPEISKDFSGIKTHLFCWKYQGFSNNYQGFYFGFGNIKKFFVLEKFVRKLIVLKILYIPSGNVIFYIYMNIFWNS